MTPVSNHVRATVNGYDVGSLEKPRKFGTQRTWLRTVVAFSCEADFYTISDLADAKAVLVI